MHFLSAAALVLAVVGTPDVSSPVVAEVNGEVITRRDVEMIASSVFKRFEARYEGEVLERKKREFFRHAVDRLVERKLLVQAARERGIEVADEDVNARMEALAERVGGWPTLLNMFAKMGISLEDRSKNVREEIMVRRVLSLEVLPRVYASPSDVRRYYEEHREEFTEPSKYRISQIIVWKSRYSAEEKAMAKLETIRAKLGEGEDFAELAGKYSDGPHAKDGGDWGLVGPKDILKELADLLWGMKAGEVRGPVETRVGFHFVKLIDMKDPVLRSFAEVHQEIENILRKRAYSLKSGRYVEDLRRRGFVRIYEEAIPGSSATP